MAKADTSYDLITLGRISMDLFSQNVGADFVDIKGFDASIGGSPSNIALGSSRLGMRVALLTAVSEDNVGKFVLSHLQNGGVETKYIPFKPNTRTGLAILGVQPPDQFPLVFYRDNPADIYLTIQDVVATPISQSRALLLSGTALSRGSCRDATLFAAELANANGVPAFMDLDLRPDQWDHPQSCGTSIRSILPLLDVVIGTEEEFYASLATNSEGVMLGKMVTDAQREELEDLVRAMLVQTQGPKAWVLKRGEHGVSIYLRDGSTVSAAGFQVEIVNTVGAGDAFASGLIYGYLKGWDWHKCARMGNACGAIVVSRHGCAAALPYEQEVHDFVTERGGF